MAQRTAGVLPYPPAVVRVAELGDFAVGLDLFVWIDPPQRVEALDVIDRMLEGGKAALLEAGIDLPYLMQQMLFHDQTEATDGDRTRQREGWPARPGGNPPPRWQAANDVGSGRDSAGARSRPSRQVDGHAAQERTQR